MHYIYIYMAFLLSNVKSKDIEKCVISHKGSYAYSIRLPQIRLGLGFKVKLEI